MGEKTGNGQSQLSWTGKNMIRTLIFILIMILPAGCSSSDKYDPRDGDIIFHTSRSAQSVAIQKATKSQYSHMGIVYLKSGKPYVFEAFGPVKLTPLKDWIRRGVDGRYVVKRLANADKILTDNALERMMTEGKAFRGKPYDIYFEWSDNRIYCSELVWKIYKRALNIELGRLQKMREFDFSDPAVKARVRKRYGDRIPKDEPVISPARMFSADGLVTVYRN